MIPTEKLVTLTQRVDLFHGLKPEDVAKIFAKGMTLRVEKGEAVFYAGTTGSQMYVVLGGLVGIFDGDKQIATMRTGDMFGEMALISNEPRSASAVALQDSHLFVLDEATFHKLLTKHVSIRILLNVIGTLCRRLRDANARLRDLTSG